MKAVIVHEFGPYDGAEVGELPDPIPGPGEVVVDLAASETNFPDILYIEGKYQKKPAFPFSPGLAGAGTISAVGDGVDPSRLGQRVLTLPGHGTYAEKVAGPADWCFPIPDDMPFEAAASFGLVYQTAWFALVQDGRLTAGETVLVLGATGGIGMAAIQIAKALGATVIAATRGSEGAALARELGADHTVDSAMETVRDGLRAKVRSATGGQGADVVIDPVGGDLTGAALRAMNWGGRLVVVGFAAGEIPQIAANYLLLKGLTVTGMQWTEYRARRIDAVREAQSRMWELWAAGKLAPKITATYPLKDYAKALKALKSGQASGKIMLTIGDTV